MPSNVIPGSLALGGFIVAIIAGLAAGNPATTTLERSLLAMGGCWLMGWVIGALVEVAVRDDAKRRARATRQTANAQLIHSGDPQLTIPQPPTPVPESARV